MQDAQSSSTAPSQSSSMSLQSSTVVLGAPGSHTPRTPPLQAATVRWHATRPQVNSPRSSIEPLQSLSMPSHVSPLGAAHGSVALPGVPALPLDVPALPLEAPAPPLDVPAPPPSAPVPEAAPLPALV